MGPEGIEKVFAASVQVALETKTVTTVELSKTICDTTVMPKAIAHPTDTRLIHKSLERIVRAARKNEIPLKRSYQRVSRWALKEYQRLMHGKKFRKGQKPLNKLKRYLSKTLRELDPLLETCPHELLRAAAIGAKLLIQTCQKQNLQLS